MWTYASHSLGHVPRSKITELRSNSEFKTERNRQTVFQIGGTILHFHQQCMRVLMFLYPCQFLFLFCFFLYNHLVGMNSHLTVALIHISLMTSNVEHLFRCLLDICRSSSERQLFRSFASLLMRQIFDLHMNGHCRHLIHIYLLNWISKRMNQYRNYYIPMLIMRK